METSVPADQFLRFEGNFRLDLVMPIIIDRYGSKMARDLERAILECIDHPSKRPDVRYPSY